MSSEMHEWLPLDTARNAFQWLVTGPEPLSLDGRDFAGLPPRLVPLDEVRDRLMSKQCPARARDTVWSYLVDRSRRDGATWTVACVGMALPALAGAARWMAARYRGDREDVHAAVLAGFIEALRTVNLEDPGIVVRLAWAARRAGQAALEESLDAPLPVETEFRSTIPQPPYGHPDLVLACAVEAGVLTATEAELISATRLGETTVTAWARERGVAVKTVFKARDRAEDRLVAWLRESGQDSDSADPVADSAVRAATSLDVATGPDSASLRSLAVSGRCRNGRPARRSERSRSVSKTPVRSRLLGRGENSSNRLQRAEPRQPRRSTDAHDAPPATSAAAGQD